MSDVRLVARGSGKESFIVTREQISELVDKAYERGQENGFKPRAFECECDALQLNDWSGQQVARAKWLHIVIANHLRKARKTTKSLRAKVASLEDRLECERDELYGRAIDEIARRVHMARCYPVWRESLMQLAGGMTVFAASLFGVSSDEVTDAVSERVEAMGR